MNWMPIETAPKDGTRVLGFGTIPVFDEDAGRTTVVQTVSVIYRLFNSWMEYPARPSFVQGLEFTHWMPLPEPPK